MTTNPAKYSVILLTALGLAFASAAQAAPKKRTRNQNRIGPYGAAFIGQTGETSEQTANEEAPENILTINEIPFQNLTSDTEDTDIGYQATFGYRFHRFFSFELGLVQYGEMISKANAELDLGEGFVPA